MNKAIHKRLALVISVIMLAAIFLSACESAEPRIPSAYTYSPGAAFQTNFNYEEDLRRQIRCVIVFKVVDEAAIEELEANNFIVRNAVLSVLGDLTLPEITTERDLDRIGQKIVDRVNEDLQGSYDLIVRAFFTDFALT